MLKSPRAPVTDQLAYTGRGELKSDKGVEASEVTLVIAKRQSFDGNKIRRLP